MTTSVDDLIEEHLTALHGLYQLLNGRRPNGQRLSPRELRVVSLAAATPLTNKEMGRKLFMAEDTVKSHMRTAFRKLGIQRRHQVAQALATPVGVE